LKAAADAGDRTLKRCWRQPDEPRNPATVGSWASTAVGVAVFVGDLPDLAGVFGDNRVDLGPCPFGEAVQVGRIAIGGISAHTLEWVTPVLYPRGEDARVFTVADTARPIAGASATALAEPSAREVTLHGLYVQGLAELRSGRIDNAIALFDSALALDSSYRPAAEQRDRAVRTRRARSWYALAGDAERSGDWGLVSLEG
jgi:hypothetical protein